MKLLYPLILLFLAFSLPAQTELGYQLLDQKDFDGALEAFKSVAPEHETYAPAQWGIAQIMGNAEYPKHDMDRAIKQIPEIQTLLRKNKDDKAKKKWERKYDLSTESIKNLGKSVAAARWAELDGAGNLEGLDVFISEYKRYSLYAAKKAAAQQQLAALRQQLTGGAKTYTEIKYVIDKHADAIRDSFPGRLTPLNKDLLSAFLAQKGRSLDSILVFLKANPAHPLSADPAAYDFQQACAAGDGKSLVAFLARHTASPFDEFIYEHLTQHPLSATEAAALSPDTQDLYDDIKIGNQSGVKILCNSTFNGEGFDFWKKYITRHKDDACGRNTFKSVMNYYVQKGDWKMVTRTIDEMGGLFPDRQAEFKALRDIAVAPENNAKPILLEYNISTTGAEEYAPALSADGRTLAFCGVDRKEKIRGEDMYITEKKDDGSWTSPTLIRELSSTSHEAPLCFTADGNTLIFFDNGRIYESQKTASGWGARKNFGVNTNEFYWTADVHFVPGEQIVFFAARKTGSGTNTDIWMAAKDEDGRWGKPQRLDSPINSDAHDRSPFIHSDQRTMYFSSDREGGLGELDVYKSVRLDDTWLHWSEPVNMGKSINNEGPNWGYIVTTDGSTAYFSAKLDGRKNEDLYYIELPEELRPAKSVQTIEVTVIDEKKKEVPNVQVELRQTKTGATIGQYRTAPKNGKVNILLPEGDEFTISAIKTGSYCNPVRLEVKNGKATKEKVTLELLTLTKSDTLKFDADILFDIGKSDLKPEASGEIRFLAELAKKQNLKMELGGYTDPSGSPSDNLLLSQARAEAVRTALINDGVKEENITAKGYGEKNLVCKENTPECYRRNRRVEVRLQQ